MSLLDFGTTSSKTTEEIFQDFLTQGMGQINKGSTPDWVMDNLRRDPMIQAIDQVMLYNALRDYYFG